MCLHVCNISTLIQPTSGTCSSAVWRQDDGVSTSTILLSIVAGLVLALAIDLFGVAGLIVVTLLLVLGIRSRALTAVLAPAIASAVILAFSVIATTHCDPAIQDCTVGTPMLVLFGWLVLVMVVGVVATLRLVPRPRPTI